MIKNLLYVVRFLLSLSSSHLMLYSRHMHPWEREYRNPQFITLGIEPLADVRDFMRWLKKYLKKEGEEFQDLTTWTGLDVGCGNGKNIKYVVDAYIHQGIGYDISTTAIALAQKLKESSPITYEVQSIGEKLPLKEDRIDLVLDNTSSHALNEKERKIYLAEMVRVLRPGGFFMIRTLCLDGDTNAKNLIKQSPAGEPNTYELASTGMREHVFTEKDFRDFYGESFHILFLKKTSGYQKWGNQSYKRNYLIAYLQKSRKYLNKKS